MYLWWIRRPHQRYTATCKFRPQYSRGAVYLWWSRRPHQRHTPGIGVNNHVQNFLLGMCAYVGVVDPFKDTLPTSNQRCSVSLVVKSIFCRRFCYAGNDQDLKEYASVGVTGIRTRVQYVSTLFQRLQFIYYHK
jgi:hypothetical protein